MTNLIPAVAYIRMSSDKQEASPQRQREEITSLAVGKYRIVRWYSDEGISGAKSKQRLGFQRLIADASEAGDFKVVLCWDQDRFSRFDPVEANYYWHILRQAGVKIVTATQGELDLSSLGGWLTTSVTQYGKAQYLRDLSRNVLSGRLSKAKQGRWTGNRAPYGYRLEDGKLLLAESTIVKTVQWIFRQYVETDTSLHDLAEQLNQRGIDSPSGKGMPWHRSALQVVLRREAYLGKAAQLKDAKGEYYTIRDGSVTPITSKGRKPEAEWYYVDCPQIVSHELFERAQAKLSTRKRQTYSRRSPEGGLLTGLLRCSHCGGHMVAAWGGRSAKPGEKFYQCSNYNARGNHVCHRNLFHESIAIGFLIPKIQETVLAPANFSRLTDAVRREIVKRQKAIPNDLEILSTQLEKCDDELTAANRELRRVPDDLYDMAVEEVRQLKYKRDRASRALEEAQGRYKAAGSDVDRLVQVALGGLHKLQKRLQSADVRTARGALQEIVDGIDLEFRHTKHAKIIRSKFERGTVRFKSCNAVAPLSRPASPRD